MASANRLPMVGSLLALIEPTLAISSLLATGLAIVLRCATAASTALSMPRRMAVGLLPAAMFRRPSRKIGPGQHRGRGGAVAGHVGGLRRHLVDQLGAHVLEAVFQLDFLAHRHAVLGDGRAAEGFVEDHVAAGRAEGYGHHVGQFFHPAEHPLAGLICI